MRVLNSFFVLLAVGILFSSCFLCEPVTTLDSSLKSSKTGGGNNWLPADFDPKTTVLLIERVQWPERQQELIKEFMKEKYPYKYRFLRSPNIDEDFPDTATHRFVLLYSADTRVPEVTYRNVSGHRGVTITMFDFHFYDRSRNISYPATGRGASWASKPFKTMINYILAHQK